MPLDLISVKAIEVLQHRAQLPILRMPAADAAERLVQRAARERIAALRQEAAH